MRKSKASIEKVRQEVLIENSRFADSAVGAGMCGGNSVSGTGQGYDSL